MDKRKKSVANTKKAEKPAGYVEHIAACSPESIIYFISVAKTEQQRYLVLVQLLFQSSRRKPGSC